MDNQREVNSSKMGRITKPLIGLLLMVIFIGLVLFWVNSQGKINYTISGVPFYGIWNHRAGDGALFRGETAAAVFSVLDYWNPGAVKPSEIDGFFIDKINAAQEGAKNVTTQNVKEYLAVAAKDEYTAESVVLKPNEIKRYVNSEAKTPLLVYLPISVDQPADLNYYPVSVVIGVNELAGKIIMHDFWLGNNREISFSELNKLWERRPAAQRNRYLVIQPKDLAEKIGQINSREAKPSPARLPIMEKNEDMIKNYVLGLAAQAALNNELANSFLSKIVSDPGFDNDFIPPLKVQVLARLAALKLKKQDIAGALSDVTRALELNHDLDKPLANGWLGYEYTRTDKANQGVSADPYRVLGDVYLAMGEKAKADEAYKTALALNSTTQAARAVFDAFKK